MDDNRTIEARQAILKDQKMAPTMQVFCDLKTNGASTKGLNATKGGDKRPEHGPLAFNKTKCTLGTVSQKYESFLQNILEFDRMD
ncbi:hypothetical protein Pmar_PMAR029102 [Perkinsus marinus ATCC 50983]|uniref:Uncharacterized protein n=1 Tax=Perkinsus marinus (strain ATCC 50983 / TXsc) TaxID=423536 RepID=C5M0M1_PERM5|nr:hypothetical protein Pmar_PMAR029102 [Perkinsus marinus ATCC 50983]EEQ97379.1 hypothetical protein Pmar_PMAR029102 [Perkinsus marinus ATCC 50983]|eukprot:XP_002764662.1 hypothetical protein Pmar_PMAR029102 [Perkinsus marinus ATCC 50983]